MPERWLWNGWWDGSNVGIFIWGSLRNILTCFSIAMLVHLSVFYTSFSLNRGLINAHPWLWRYFLLITTMNMCVFWRKNIFLPGSSVYQTKWLVFRIIKCKGFPTTTTTTTTATTGLSCLVDLGLLGLPWAPSWSLQRDLPNGVHHKNLVTWENQPQKIDR